MSALPFISASIESHPWVVSEGLPLKWSPMKSFLTHSATTPVLDRCENSYAQTAVEDLADRALHESARALRAYPKDPIGGKLAE